MRRVFLAIIVSTLLCGQSTLPAFPPGMFSQRGALDGTISYSGPGNVVTSALVWYGLRAYSAATRGNALINACNVGDAACADVPSDASIGALTISAIGGESCNVAITSGTYVSATGVVTLIISASPNLASGNVLALSALTGTGNYALLNGSYTAGVGTTGTTVVFTAASGLGTLTVTGGYINVCTIKTLYNFGSLGSGYNAAQATISKRAVLILNGGLPAALCNGTGAYTAGIGTAIPVPFSISVVANRTAVGAQSPSLLGADDGVSTYNYDFWGGSGFTDQWEVGSASGAFPTTGISMNDFHIIQGVFDNTLSSVTVDDQTAVTGTLGTVGIASTDTVHLCGDGYGDYVSGMVTEAGIWPVALSSTQIANLTANQNAYWQPPLLAATLQGYGTTALSENWASTSTIDVNNTLAGGFKWYVNGQYPNIVINSGYNFTYLKDPWVTPSSDISVNGGVLTLAAASGQDNLTTCAWNGSAIVGNAYGGGFYIDIPFSFNPALSSGTGSLSFWFLPKEFLNGTITTTNFVEADGFECILGTGHCNSRSVTNHDWNESTTPETNNYGLYSIDSFVSSSVDYTQMHHYGFKWTPAALNGGIGQLKSYFDGAEILTQNYLSGAAPSPALGPNNVSGALYEMDAENMCLIIYSGNTGQPIHVGPTTIMQP